MSNNDLARLLAFLDASEPATPCDWHEWQVALVAGGANNRVYHVSGESAEYAVKFTVRDDRDRAGREYAALQVIAASKPQLAPRPVLLDRNSFVFPVVVQTWLNGDTLSSPPATPEQWNALLDYYCAIHRITPERTTITLQPATLHISSVAAGKALVAEHATRIPKHEQPAQMVALLDRFAAWHVAAWPTPPMALCRVDSN